MASVCVGIGTSHSPVLNVGPEHWHVMADYDRLPGKELLSPRSGKLTSYGSLLAEADPAIGERLSADVFAAQHAAIQRGIGVLEQTLRDARPDAAIVIGADQEEWFFEDNMPAISIFCKSGVGRIVLVLRQYSNSLMMLAPKRSSFQSPGGTCAAEGSSMRCSNGGRTRSARKTIPASSAICKPASMYKMTPLIRRLAGDAR